MKSLKEQNKPNLILFTAWNVIIILIIFSSPLFINDGEVIAQKLLSHESIFMIFSPIIVIIINGLLNSEQKVFLVFWKWKNGLPAHCAFTKYLFLDPRIDLDNLKSKYEELPVNPVKQNSLWYRFLTNNEGNIIVKESHKSYLLTRDMTAMSFVFLLSIVVIFFSNLDIKIKLLSSGYFVFQYFILMLVTRNFGKRFTCNVLAVESQK